jgi:hypothetical protein
MPRHKEEHPTSLPDYLAIIESRQRVAFHSLWYRGCGFAGHTLLPSLYRHKKAKTPEALADLERQLMTRFRQRSIPYHNRSLADDWDALFFMQHYAVPTRLLDWTENPLIALHFALMGAKYQLSAKGLPVFDSGAAVWMLDPVAWNRAALKHQSYEGGVLTPDDDALKGYRPVPKFSGMHNHPVALYGAHNSARIVAQQGAFTIFGRNTTPMESVVTSTDFPEDCLVKVVLRKGAIAAMRRSLLNHGITESVVFPDLEGLAREIKRVFGFET